MPAETGPIIYQSAAVAERSLHAAMKMLHGFSRKARTAFPETASLYIFNVSNRTWKWREPGFEMYTVLPCEEGQEVSPPCKIPGIVTEEYLDGDKTELNHYNAGEIAAAIMGFGPGFRPDADLRQFGVFASRTNPPLNSEVAEAKRRLVETCESLLKEGDMIHSQGQAKGPGGQMLNELHAWAAKVLRQTRDWSKSSTMMVDCPFCSNPVAATAAVHFGVNGCGAVLNWDRAIASGLKKEEDRPVATNVKAAKAKE